MRKRTTRTYTIADDIYKKFDELVKENNINRSRLIENLIVKYIESLEKSNSKK